GTARMPVLADTAGAVIGVDAHTGSHTACLAGRLGRPPAVITVPGDPRGCRRLPAWARQHAPGPQLAWSVEGTRTASRSPRRAARNAPAGGRAVSLTPLTRPA